MTGRGRNSQTASDDARWAQALSILEGRPDLPAEQSLQRVRRNRLLMISAFIVLTVVVALVVGALFLDVDGPGSRRDEDVPTSLRVVGLSVSGLGLVVMLVGGVLLVRRLRGARGWRSPLTLLTFRQRRELVAQLRGRAPLVPERAPLVGHLADVLLAQRVALLPQAGLLLNFTGLWIADRSTWRLVGIVVLVAVLVVVAVFGRRDLDRSRRFLREHPPVKETP